MQYGPAEMRRTPADIESAHDEAQALTLLDLFRFVRKCEADATLNDRIDLALGVRKVVAK